MVVRHRKKCEERKSLFLLGNQNKNYRKGIIITKKLFSPVLNFLPHSDRMGLLKSKKFYEELRQLVHGYVKNMK